MLKKRNISQQKGRKMNHSMPDPISEIFFHSDVLNQKHKNNSFFNPRSSESDPLRSPTSPFDFGIFSSFGNPFRCRKSQNEGYHKSWDHSKVGLSIVDSLVDETKELGKVIRSCNCRSVIFGRKMSVSSSFFCGDVTTKQANVPNSSSDFIFEIGDVPSENLRAFSLESKSFGGSPKLEKSICSGTGFISSIPASEIELSEDYTCVRTHGPNPKVTHIFGDCILEKHGAVFSKKNEDELTNPEAVSSHDVLDSHHLDNFLKFCYSCHKNLDGEDIYMYRGEKAFCSCSCRSKEIEIDEEMEKTDDNSLEIFDKSNSSCEDITKMSSNIFFTTT